MGDSTNGGDRTMRVKRIQDLRAAGKQALEEGLSFRSEKLYEEALVLEKELAQADRLVEGLGNSERSGVRDA